NDPGYLKGRYTADAYPARESGYREKAGGSGFPNGESSPAPGPQCGSPGDCGDLAQIPQSDGVPARWSAVPPIPAAHGPVSLGPDDAALSPTTSPEGAATGGGSKGLE